MRLTEILKPANIKIPLEAKTKTEAITELVNLLAANGEIKEPKKVLDSVLDREAMRTTGIGNGLAIPHGKCTGTDHLVMAIGKPATPIDFQAIDGRPVSIIWMLNSPPDKTGPHIHALAQDQPADDHGQIPRWPARRKNRTGSVGHHQSAGKFNVISGQGRDDFALQHARSARYLRPLHFVFVKRRNHVSERRDSCRRHTGRWRRR